MRSTVKLVLVATCFVALGWLEHMLVRVQPGAALLVAFCAGAVAVWLTGDANPNPGGTTT